MRRLSFVFLALFIAFALVACGGRRGNPTPPGTDAGTGPDVPVLPMDAGTDTGGRPDVIVLADTGVDTGPPPECAGNSGCGAGQACTGGTCVDDCRTGNPCSAGMVCGAGNRCEPAPMECPSDILTRAVSLCDVGTRDCLAACTAGDTPCFDRCVDVIGGADCQPCINNNALYCANLRGCQTQWNCFIGCANDFGCEDRECALANCGPEDSAYSACEMTAGADGACAADVQACLD